MADYKLSINEEYAEKYEKRKKAEELSKLQEKYGGQIPSSDSEDTTSEEEDEDGEDDTAEKSKDFFLMLSLLKKKDPRIYNKKIDLFKDTNESSNISQKVTQHKKPLYLKDYERERLLEKGTMAGVSDTDEEEEMSRGDGGLKERILYDQEQRDNMESFKQAVANVDSDDEGLLTIRQKTDKEKEEEEADYIKWLKGHDTQLHTEEMKDMDALREYWTKPTLDSDEAFLRDYILNKKWIDKDLERVPHYDEVVTEFPDPSDDEDNIDKQDQFEEKFNFRFEEPGGTKITSYPRKVENSLRKADERRKDKRKEREDRKAKEKEQKKEEIRRLKNLKKQEILDKLEKLKKITGNPVVEFNVEDFEKDFDPAHHEQMMKEQFGEDYYGDGIVDEEKPQFSDMSDKEEDWDNWEPPTNTEEEVPYCEDPDFNMDADYDPTAEEEEATSKRKRRRQNLFSRAMKKRKPSFDPEGEKEFEEYFNEYYKLDYEDIIGGDLPCRFHYRQTIPNDFGLSTQEMLLSEDRELNKWVSLKKAVQYRTVDEEKSDVKKYKKKSKDVNKKQRILATMAATTSTDHDDGVGSESTTVHVAASAHSKKQDGRVKKGKKAHKDTGRRKGGVGVSDTRLSSYGLSSNKRDNRKRTKKKTKN